MKFQSGIIHVIPLLVLAAVSFFGFFGFKDYQEGQNTVVVSVDEGATLGKTIAAVLGPEDSPPSDPVNPTTPVTPVKPTNPEIPVISPKPKGCSGSSKGGYSCPKKANLPVPSGCTKTVAGGHTCPPPPATTTTPPDQKPADQPTSKPKPKSTSKPKPKPKAKAPDLKTQKITGRVFFDKNCNGKFDKKKDEAVSSGRIEVSLSDDVKEQAKKHDYWKDHLSELEPYLQPISADIKDGKYAVETKLKRTYTVALYDPEGPGEKKVTMTGNKTVNFAVQVKGHCVGSK